MSKGLFFFNCSEVSPTTPWLFVSLNLSNSLIQLSAALERGHIRHTWQVAHSKSERDTIPPFLNPIFAITTHQYFHAKKYPIGYLSLYSGAYLHLLEKPFLFLLCQVLFVLLVCYYISDDKMFQILNICAFIPSLSKCPRSQQWSFAQYHSGAISNLYKCWRERCQKNIGWCKVSRISVSL